MTVPDVKPQSNRENLQKKKKKKKKKRKRIEYFSNNFFPKTL